MKPRRSARRRRLIPANDKPYGRIAAFRILEERLRKDVSLEPRPIDPNVSKEAKRVLGLSPSDIKRASEAGHTEVPAETTESEVDRERGCQARS